MTDPKVEEIVSKVVEIAVTLSGWIITNCHRPDDGTIKQTGKAINDKEKRRLKNGWNKTIDGSWIAPPWHLGMD